MDDRMHTVSGHVFCVPLPCQEKGTGRAMSETWPLHLFPLELVQEKCRALLERLKFTVPGGDTSSASPSLRARKLFGLSG